MYFINFKFEKLGRAIGALSLVIWGTLALSAQDNDIIDSLASSLTKESGPTRSDIFFQLALENANKDNSASLQYAIDGYENAASYGDTLRMLKGLRLKGQAFRRVDRFNESIESFLQSLAIGKRHLNSDEYFKEYRQSLNGIAITYQYQANYEKALDFYLMALDMLESEGDKGETSIVLNNIGLVYFKLSDYNRSMQYYKRSLAYKLESGDYFDLDRLYINMGLCYNQLHDYEESDRHFEKAFAACGNQCSDLIKLEGQFGLGIAKQGQKKYNEALGHFNESFRFAKLTGNRRYMGENFLAIARINIDMKQTTLAIPFLKSADSLIAATKYNELLIDLYKQYSKVYVQLKDFEKAALYQTKYITLNDSIYSKDLISGLAKVQTKYAERENLKTIADKDEVIERQRSFQFAIVIIAILAALLIFVLFRTNSVRKKVNLALSDAKAIIEDQNRQLLSSNYNLDRELKEKNTELQKANESLLRVNDELDNFIYKTSHDIRGPLASLKGMCNVALMDVKDPLALNYLKKLDITAEKLNTILTRLLIVNQINNSALAQDRIDFDTIVNDVFLLEKKKGLPSRLKIKKNIDPGIEYYSDKEFVRIIFENLIDNAIKFYNDSQRVEPFVEVSVTQEENQIRIRVIDNGIGISEVHPDKIFQMFSRASERSETGGIGLYITKTATEKLGGSVNLKTSPEGYTEFFVLLPLSTSKVMA